MITAPIHLYEITVIADNNPDVYMHMRMKDRMQTGLQSVGCQARFMIQHGKGWFITLEP